MLIADDKIAWKEWLPSILEESLGQVAYLCELIHRVVRDIKLQPILLCAELIEAMQEAPENCRIGSLNQFDAPLMLAARAA